MKTNSWTTAGQAKDISSCPNPPVKVLRRGGHWVSHFQHISHLIRLCDLNTTLDVFCQICTRLTEYVRRMRCGQVWSRHVLVNIWDWSERNVSSARMQSTKGYILLCDQSCWFDTVEHIDWWMKNISKYHEHIWLVDANCHCYNPKTLLFWEKNRDDI